MASALSSHIASGMVLTSRLHLHLDHSLRLKRKDWQSFLQSNGSTSICMAIISDHKPLEHLFSETKATPTLASARIQRWALILGAYDYRIEYKPGPQHGNADMLSRLPLPDTPSSVTVPGETILLLDMLNSLPVTATQIKKGTDHDPVPSNVRTMLLSGWRNTTNDSFKPFQQRQFELSVHDGCILWGSRVVIPPSLCGRVHEELHEGHPGASRMKSLARSFVWWPGLGKQIEHQVQSCDSCQRSRSSTTAVGMATTPVGQCPCGLCWSIFRPHLSHTRGRPFQVDGSKASDICYIVDHNRTTAIDFRYPWSSRITCIRQWFSVYKRRI